MKTSQVVPPAELALEVRLCCAFCARLGDPQEWSVPVRRQLRKRIAHCRKVAAHELRAGAAR